MAFLLEDNPAKPEQPDFDDADLVKDVFSVPGKPSDWKITIEPDGRMLVFFKDALVGQDKHRTAQGARTTARWLLARFDNLHRRRPFNPQDYREVWNWYSENQHLIEAAQSDFDDAELFKDVWAQPSEWAMRPGDIHYLYDPNGSPVRKSRNLRGIRQYVSQRAVDTVEIRRIPGPQFEEGGIKVEFLDGYWWVGRFASFDTLKWCLRNWRNLYGAPLVIDGKSQGTVSYRNPALQEDEIEDFKDVFGTGWDLHRLLDDNGFDYEKINVGYEKWVKRVPDSIYVVSHTFPKGINQWDLLIYPAEGGEPKYEVSTNDEKDLSARLQHLLGLPESVCKLSEDETEDFKDVYAPEPERTYSLAEIKAAVPLFFDRKTMRFHGTRKIYQYGNYIVVHNVRHIRGIGFDGGGRWTVSDYVVYKFEKTAESPEGDLRYLATTKELSNAKRMIKLRDFRSEQEKQAWGDVGMEEAVQSLTLLHGTSTVHLPKIKRFGLVNACLTNNQTVANYYAQETSDEDGGHPVVLSVLIRDPKILKPDYPSFEEPLTFTYRRYASSEEEFHQMLDKGKQGIHWPADENDWKTSLRVAEAVIASYVPAKDLHPQAIHEADGNIDDADLAKDVYPAEEILRETEYFTLMRSGHKFFLSCKPDNHPKRVELEQRDVDYLLGLDQKTFDMSGILDFGCGVFEGPDPEESVEEAMDDLDFKDVYHADPWAYEVRPEKMHWKPWKLVIYHYGRSVGAEYFEDRQEAADFGQEVVSKAGCLHERDPYQGWPHVWAWLEYHKLLPQQDVHVLK